MQDTIEPVALCLALGLALSLIVAAVSSRSGRNPGGRSIVARLVLTGVPIGLGINYLMYQDAAMIACAGASAVLCLYALRGWWMPDRLSAALGRMPRPAAATPDAPAFSTPGRVVRLVTGRRRASAASAALRSRTLNVVRDDRHTERPATDSSIPRAA